MPPPPDPHLAMPLKTEQSLALRDRSPPARAPAPDHRGTRPGGALANTRPIYSGGRRLRPSAPESSRLPPIGAPQPRTAPRRRACTPPPRRAAGSGALASTRRIHSGGRLARLLHPFTVQNRRSGERVKRAAAHGADHPPRRRAGHAPADDGDPPFHLPGFEHEMPRRPAASYAELQRAALSRSEPRRATTTIGESRRSALARLSSLPDRRLPAPRWLSAVVRRR